MLGGTIFCFRRAGFARNTGDVHAIAHDACRTVKIRNFCAVRANALTGCLVTYRCNTGTFFCIIAVAAGTLPAGRWTTCRIRVVFARFSVLTDMLSRAAAGDIRNAFIAAQVGVGTALDLFADIPLRQKTGGTALYGAYTIGRTFHYRGIGRFLLITVEDLIIASAGRGGTSVNGIGFALRNPFAVVEQGVFVGIAFADNALSVQAGCIGMYLIAVGAVGTALSVVVDAVYR